jgi:hypothetical protein
MRSLSLCLLGLWLSGCANPQTYSPPRTLAKGKSSYAFALEAFDLEAGAEEVRSPSAPTFVFRHGLTDDLDLGLRAVNMSGLGADLKYNFLRSDVDVAFDPGVQWTFLSFDDNGGDGMFGMLDLPLLVGINAAPEATIVLGGGLALMGGDAIGDELTEDLGDELLYGRATLGFDLRFTQRFAVHPSATLMQGLQTRDARIIVMGCGFRIGGPSYEGLSF